MPVLPLSQAPSFTDWAQATKRKANAPFFRKKTFILQIIITAALWRKVQKFTQRCCPLGDNSRMNPVCLSQTLFTWNAIIHSLRIAAFLRTREFVKLISFGSTVNSCPGIKLRRGWYQNAGPLLDSPTFYLLPLSSCLTTPAFAFYLCLNTPAFASPHLTQNISRHLLSCLLSAWSWKQTPPTWSLKIGRSSLYLMAVMNSVLLSLSPRALIQSPALSWHTINWGLAQ